MKLSPKIRKRCPRISWSPCLSIAIAKKSADTTRPSFSPSPWRSCSSCRIRTFCSFTNGPVPQNSCKHCVNAGPLCVAYLKYAKAAKLTIGASYC
jgi:hypothetical protein